jgi:glycosyltransferase involved in cell wall biosynthesis
MMRKILIIGPVPPPDGGTTIQFRHFLDYALANRDANHSIQVLDSNTGDKTLTSILAPKMFLRVMSLTVKIIYRCFSADQIIIFGSQRFITIIGAVVVALFRPAGKKIYLRVNGGGYDVYFDSATPVAKLVIKHVLGRATRIIVETELVETNMRDTWGSVVSSAPNFRPEVRRKSRSSKGADEGVNFIYTGLVRKTKGCGELLEAFVSLERQLSERQIPLYIRLDLFGQLINTLSEPLDITPYMTNPNIAIHGAVSNDELMRHYSRADVFVFPSYWATEGHSGSVVEAMMHGLPIIAADWRATKEVVNHGTSGLLCKPSNAADLADKMFLISTDARLRSKLAQGALRESRRFDDQIVCSRLSQLFGLRE